MKRKPQDKTPEQIWQEYINNNPIGNDREWISTLFMDQLAAQEDLILAYYFLSFTRIN